MKDELKHISLKTTLNTYFEFILLIVLGHLEDFRDFIFKKTKKILNYIFRRKNNITKKRNIVTNMESFYIRRMYSKIIYCWNRPIASSPGNSFKILALKEFYKSFLGKICRNKNKKPYKTNRILKIINLENTTVKLKKPQELRNIEARETSSPVKYENDISYNNLLTGAVFKEKEITKRVINISSYNYLGFGSSNKKTIKDIINNFQSLPIVLPAPQIDTGRCKIENKLASGISNLLGTESTLIFPMGFGVNTGNIPILFEDNNLIFSDEFVHTSLIFGMKLCKSTIITFQHNDMRDLEKKLIYYISQGNDVTHRNWNKIFVVVEGVYSMEGTILDVENLLQLKAKYKFYIFLDEAHSIGVLGKRGGGVVEHFLNKKQKTEGKMPKKETEKIKRSIDIYMGTFTKSFGAVGGYISGSSELITYLKQTSDVYLYGEQLSPLISKHILSKLKKLSSSEFKGRKKLNKYVGYLRRRLLNEGFILKGEKHSPIIPLLVFSPKKLALFSIKCLERGLAVVVVGYPATPILTSRARICLSAAHTRTEIKKISRIIVEIGKELGLNISAKKQKIRKLKKK